MDALPHDIVALSLLVFALGLKHGFDADHLATIDGLTRYNARRQPTLARYCGVLFSLGHGAVVMLIALTVSTLAQQWQTPDWLDTLGAWISIAFLCALGSVNILAVLNSHPTEVVRPHGLKGGLLGRLNRTSQPLLIALVGALFALSFDTISQAALFAMTASQFGGWQAALLLGFLFMSGMLVTDGINGLWISRLIRRADQLALVASRVISLAVGSLSLLVALLGILKFTVPGIDEWSEGKELLFGATVVGIIIASYLLAVWLTRPRLLAATEAR